MALPTLRPFWMKNYKNTSEAMMAQRNQKQADFREKWNQNSQYFQRSDIETAKQNGWTSDYSYQRSMDAIGDVYNKSTKQIVLEKRKKKLAELLCEENNQFEIEMKDRHLCNPGSMLQMSERAENLKQAREERRKKVAEEKLFDHWKENEPELRTVMSEQRQKKVIQGWGEQITERDDIQKTARDNDRRVEHRMELNRLAAIEEERKRAEQRKHEETQLKAHLQQQVAELKIKEEEGQMLKREEEVLERQKIIVDSAEEERSKFDELRKKQEYGRVLVRQYKAQLRRKSKQVQEALELDLKILEDLSREAQSDVALKTARRDSARADANNMKKVVAEQLQLEKSREAELDMMYQEEASRQWQKRESEWERERLARERLMKEVLKERQKQVDYKMVDLHRRQQEWIEERENLIYKMENHQQMLVKENENDIKKRKEREQEIVEQITSRTEQRKDHEKRQQEQFYEKRLEEETYKMLLEKEVMTAREETPKSFHRRRFAFY